MYLGQQARTRVPEDADELARRALLLKRGDARAFLRPKALPTYDHSVHYLRLMVTELHGRSGVSMNGVVPLTWPTLESYARMKQLALQPHECEALMRLDHALCFPPALES